MHAVAPDVAKKVPTRQFEQLDEDVEDEYVPAKQFEHTVDEEAEYEPAAQTPVTAERPAVSQ